MISRRTFLASSLAAVGTLALCTSCEPDDDANDGGGEVTDAADDGGLATTRERVSPDGVVGVYLFSLDGRSIAEIDEDDLAETIEALSYLDSEASEEPSVVSEGGASGGRPRMFFVVLKSATTLTVGEGGTEALYDSVGYACSYDACSRVGDLYARLIEKATF